MNRLFVLLFENNTNKIQLNTHKILSSNCRNNVMIDGQNLFDQPVKNNLITYDNIWKITTGQGDYFTTGCLLDYNYFHRYYTMIDTFK